MMKINIAELANRLDSAQDFSFTTTADELEARLDDRRFAGNIVVKGRISYTGSAFRVAGTVEDVKEFTCDRCLKECSENECHEFSEEFVQNGDSAEDANIFSGDVLDITDLVRDILLAGQSIGNVCQPDCKGLCPVCGKDLNEGECDCDRFVPDPRMAALQQLLKRE